MSSKNGHARTALIILPMIFVLLVIALAAGAPAAGFAERGHTGNQGAAPVLSARRAAELCLAGRARHYCMGSRGAGKGPAFHTTLNPSSIGEGAKTLRGRSPGNFSAG
jgi:hypothetical protein